MEVSIIVLVVTKHNSRTDQYKDSLVLEFSSIKTILVELMFMGLIVHVIKSFLEALPTTILFDDKGDLPLYSTLLNFISVTNPSTVS